MFRKGKEGSSLEARGRAWERRGQRGSPGEERSLPARCSSAAAVHLPAPARDFPSFGPGASLVPEAAGPGLPVTSQPRPSAAPKNERPGSAAPEAAPASARPPEKPGPRPGRSRARRGRRRTHLVRPLGRRRRRRRRRRAAPSSRPSLQGAPATPPTRGALPAACDRGARRRGRRRR